jgi:hypothetical protein
MNNSDSSSTPKPKGKWDKIDIILRPVGGLLTALSVALLGYLCTSHLETWRTSDSNYRLYAELMSTREASDSALRQGMFNTIVSRFLDPEIITSTETASKETISPEDAKAKLELSILRLEMLAYNFHDSLDLSPLFKNVQRTLSQSVFSQDIEYDKNSRDALVKRLEKVAKEVVDKQLSTLEEEHNITRTSFAIDREEEFIQKLIHKKLCYGSGPEASCKAFSVDVISFDQGSKEVEVRLTVWSDTASDTNISSSPVVDVTFVVNYFDFPLVDNSRIGGGERCALVLSDFTEYEAFLSLVYFPGSRASLKEKQFYDDILQELQQMREMMN